ncbi:hypothetical protein QE152_g37209 [Popillia japonica]|uniref:Uncharacterized protein n=1 Tax=Popillia japonica TaxID=7064 RepID=A0AAW1IAM1_POPJA
MRKFCKWLMNNPQQQQRYEHHVIHVPYNVHTVHHHHVKKVVVPVPIVKKVVVAPIIHEPIIGHIVPVRNINTLAKYIVVMISLLRYS